MVELELDLAQDTIQSQSPKPNQLLCNNGELAIFVPEDLTPLPLELQATSPLAKKMQLIFAEMAFMLVINALASEGMIKMTAHSLILES